MLYGSVHVDPGAGWFPHVVGYADETGRRRRAGATRNLPLAAGHRRRRLARRPSRDLADWVVAAGCTALVVSLGVDAAARRPGEPAAGHPRRLPRGRATLLGGTGLPAVVVQEGGYHLPTLGGLVAAYLDGHASETHPGTTNGPGPEPGAVRS